MKFFGSYSFWLHRIKFLKRGTKETIDSKIGYKDCYPNDHDNFIEVHQNFYILGLLNLILLLFLSTFKRETI